MVRSRNALVAVDGRHVRPLTVRGRKYLELRQAAPDRPNYECAIEAGYSSKGAYGRALLLDKHPTVRKVLEQIMGEVLDKMGLSAEKWVEMVLSDRELARTMKHPDPTAALKADLMLKEHVQIHDPGNVLKEPAAPLPPGGNVFNFNGPNPFSGWSLEELQAWREEHRSRLVEGQVTHTDG